MAPFARARTAWVGTVSTSVSCLTVTATVAVVPACSPSGVPVTSMTTGKAAVPDEEDDATTPTLLTVPKTFWGAPLGVIVACSPFVSRPRSEAPTVALTSQEFVAMTTTCAEDADDADVLPDPVEPVPPEPPPPPEPEPFVVPVDEPEVLDPPVTVSPTPTFTAATVPAIDAVSVAWPNASCAAVTLLWAEVTWALAEAI